MVNIWHDAPIGDDAPEIVNAAIEIPAKSRAKYEICKDTGLLRLDRVLYSAVYYPANYGFIPGTLGEDNDPLDIMVVSQADVYPLCLMDAKVLGVMRMIDNGEGDDKIIAVAKDDVSVAHINEISQLPQSFLAEINHFFEEYKRLEKKTVKVEGFQDKQTACKIIEESVVRYKQKFEKIPA